MLTTVTVIYSDGTSEQTIWTQVQGEMYAHEMRVWQRIDSRKDSGRRILQVSVS